MEPLSGHLCTCSERLDEDVCPLAHGPDDGHALGPLQVERDRPLPPGEHVRLVGGAAFRIQCCREIDISRDNMICYLDIRTLKTQRLYVTNFHMFYDYNLDYNLEHASYSALLPVVLLGFQLKN